MKNIINLFLCLLSLVFMCSCGYTSMSMDKMAASLFPFQWQSPIKTSPVQGNRSSILTGQINSLANHEIVIVAFATDLTTSNSLAITPVDSTIVKGTGPFWFFLPQGQYHLFSFLDINNDGFVEKNEFLSPGETIPPTTLHENQVVGGLDITINDLHVQDFFFPLKINYNKSRRNIPAGLSAGQLVYLNDETFNPEFRAMGLWKPQDFLGSYGADVYCLETPVPGKIPVLFVHGANGSPVDFSFLVENLDRKRFQPWFFFYPTYLKLETTGALLNERIKDIHRLTGFDSIHVVSHSMGGLVARSFINKSLEENKFSIPVFISISTPWNGSKPASLGVEYSPAHVDSWEDMSPDSPFVEELFNVQLAENTSFFLVFTYGGNSRMQKEANDGAITLESQLSEKAKEAARETIGFHEDHSSILKSQDLSIKINNIINGNYLNAGVLPEPVERKNLTPSKDLGADKKTVNQLSSPARAQQDQTLAPLVIVKTISLTPNVDACLNNQIYCERELKEYLKKLRSKNTRTKLKAARLVYKTYSTHPLVHELVKEELRQKQNLLSLNRNHIDAMAWFCNILGSSGKLDYRETLENVLEITTNKKLKGYARKNLKRLPKQ
jgi:pimeloyl-ACP methyl ester carboxylesterase